MAEMMGIDHSWMFREVKRIGGNDSTKRKMSDAQIAEWKEFCNPPFVTLDPLEEITPCEEQEEYFDTGVKVPIRMGCSIGSGLLQFTGKAPDIAIALMKFLGDREYRISVEFEELA